MTDLLTRLESSEGSDHQLTIDICEKLDLAPKEYFGSKVISYSWESGVINTEKARHLDALLPPPILTSLDAALSLVERMLPKCGVNIDIAPDGQETVCVHIQQSEAEWTYHGWPAEFAKTAPRAVLKALLRTLETREKDKRALDQEPQT